MSSTIEVEKFEREPGIYIIFNKDNNKVYIGQAKDLKRRMVQHIQILFDDKENKSDSSKKNKKVRKDSKALQEEFNKDIYGFRMVLLKQVCEKELNKYESFFFQAAVMIYGRENVYNKVELYNEPITDKQMQETITIIKEAKQRNEPGMYTFRTKEDTRQDWLKITHKELKVGTVSLREMYEKNMLDNIIISVAGDYVGENKPQTITEILLEKIGELGDISKGKCLWAGAGPSLSEFKVFKEKHGFGKEKKVYALIYFTLSEFDKKDIISRIYYYKDKEGNILRAKVPFREHSKYNAKYKALIIDKIWTVEEDFPIIEIYKYYYRYGKACISTIGGMQRHVLNSELSDRRIRCAVSKKAILNSKEIQKELLLEGELLEQFKKERASEEEIYYSFIPCNDEQHPVRYVLAEVLDYVEIKADNPQIVQNKM